jgi:hypothetical protein
VHFDIGERHADILAATTDTHNGGHVDAEPDAMLGSVDYAVWWLRINLGGFSLPESSWRSPSSP